MPTPAPVPVSFGSLVLALSLLGGGVLVAKRATADGTDQPGNILASAGLVPGTDTAPATAPRLGQTLGTTRVKDLSGKVVPLVPAGQPGVLMISSRTCSWCKRTLKDLGEMSGTRALPRFTVLTLEGASEGVPMLAKEHLTGARLVGPATGNDEVLLTFRFPGTPTLIAVDRNGRVVRVIPGYPIRDELQRLWSVMVGESTAP
ncbi:MAG: hypothetical protein K2R93_06220 [Gemmatimonadaceae bacterium]|nr:hypothetical protein [Gemmatimonadaceae bacterium]